MPSRDRPDSVVALTKRELRRYGRHLVLPEVGVEGQRRLKGARVLLIGAGGLGSPVGLYLAAAGVGTLGLVDFDVVDESNLQRQILYGEKDVGRPKVAAAVDRLQDVNPLIGIEAHEERFSTTNAERLLAEYDLVVDGSDNFATRYLVNDACVLFGKPNVYGSIFRFEGQVSVFATEGGPCYRCLFPEPPPPGLIPSCAEGGVLGVLPGIVGALQANEAVKWILGRGTSLVGRLLLVDALGAGFRELQLPRDPECPVCGDEPSITTLTESANSCAAPEPAVDPELEFEVQPQELARWLESGRTVTLLDVRTPIELAICKLADSVFVPLHELTGRHEELDRGATIVVYCHHGIRSAQAVKYLRQQGFARAINLAGGLEAWRHQVDPSMPGY